MRDLISLLVCLVVVWALPGQVIAQNDSAEFPNTQKEVIPFTPPHKALEMMEVPEGFEVSVFAHEPDVHQPIAMTFDAKGRLWVVENYTYSDNKENFNEELCDRVVIFEDKDNDGKFDERKIFWDQGKKLTGIELGRGGVWLTAAPQFIFIPDADRDDVPDGPPKVILDGFEDDTIRHNFVNGLRWGPNGWLYSRHGIQAVSFVGKPGEPKSKRTPMNCCVWRYHPERDVFEIVAEGGTNFWGLDFDEHGEMFVINTVIGHLFHIVPGARYNRMHGSHFNPYTYQTIAQTADHFHWDRNEKWWDAKNTMKESGGGTDKAGGGHAHSGFMIYQGDNWPKQFRGRAFTLNFHGRRINQEVLEREGNSYVAKHAPDMFRTADPWFRGVELSYGPDGAVYVLDWSDIGECHENDGIHRTSGRIFKIAYGQTQKPTIGDLFDLPDEKLVELLKHKNEWYARMATRVLLDRKVEQVKHRKWPISGTASLLKLAKDPLNDPSVQIRAICTLAQIMDLAKRNRFGTQRNSETKRSSEIEDIAGLKSKRLIASRAGISGFLVREVAKSPNEHVRATAVKLLSDWPIRDQNSALCIRKMADDPSSLVRLYVASSIRQLDLAMAFSVASKLVAKEKDMEDRVQPKLIWHQIEPRITADFERSMFLFEASKSQMIRQNIVRRLASDPDKQDLMMEKLVRRLLPGTQAHAADILRGIVQAIEGRRQMKAPISWNELVAKQEQFDVDSVKLIEEISPVFGDGLSIERLMKLAANSKADSIARSQAIQSLSQHADPEKLFPVLKREIGNRQISPAVVKAMAVCDTEEVADAILGQYKWLPSEGQKNAIDTLCSRKQWSKRLLGAIKRGRVPPAMVTAWHARQIQAFDDPELTKQLNETWGKVRETNEERMAQVEELRELMTNTKMTGVESTAIGKKLFVTHCASCHALFGEGGNIGPDLTGSDRKNLNYLLENILDPSASVATGFRTSVLAMDDGRLLTGVVMENNGQTLRLQTKEELLVLEVDSIEEIKQTELSLMPDGLLDKVSDGEKVELFRYLMSR